MKYSLACPVEIKYSEHSENTPALSDSLVRRPSVEGCCGRTGSPSLPWALGFYTASLALFLSSFVFASAKSPVDYVDPNIGGIAQLTQQSTQPLVQMPYGMVRIAPLTTPGIADRYLADHIYGFPAAGGLLMPFVGPIETDAAKRASEYDHTQETATPYYYSALLGKYNVSVEYTVSERALFYRLAFPQTNTARCLLSVPDGGNVQVVGPATMAGYGPTFLAFGTDQTRRNYFYAEFSKPFAATTSWTGPQPAPNRFVRVHGGSGIVTTFMTEQAEKIGVRIGTSYISVEQAQQNLAREIPDWNFARCKARARERWDQELGRITVQGGTERERRIFYTALYRVLGQPEECSEYGHYWSPADNQVHAMDNDGKFYVCAYLLWGSFRSLLPLQLLLDPEQQVDFIRSYLRMYDERGWLLGPGRFCMIGHHIAALVLDTYMKGYQNFDVEKAYAGLKKNATEATMLPWRSGSATALDKVYYEKGFFPALAKGETETCPQVHPFERRQAVAVTLEHAYDDWCVAQFAKALHKDTDCAYFSRRAQNYRKVYNTRTGFMSPKSADGNWVQGFDPKTGGGQGGRDYFTEMNGWTYSFHVQHDVEGLIELMGGREKFVERLDALFNEQYSGPKYKFLAQFPDATGLIGQYAQGNEPSFHIPYLYNHAGAPWKTQRRVRQIMNIWFNDNPLGMSGDEDDGEESSWYVFSAMGFYPFCPGRPVYDIGSPIFDEVRIALRNGKMFTIRAHNNSAMNQYVQSARLNGQTLDQPYFTHEDLTSGGTLVLEMGPRPNQTWGVEYGIIP